MCQRSAVFGFKNYANGGFAEYIKLPKGSRTHVLPKNFTTEQGVLVEPIACGMHALEQAHIDHNDVVVISGLGAIEKGLIRTDGLISHTYKLADWKEAFETAANDPNAVKVMLEP